MLSAITSRDTSEHFIPSVPIEMPSLIVMVPKRLGHAAGRAAACLGGGGELAEAGVAGRDRAVPLATATMGLSKSSSPKPTARSMARFGARWSPWVTMAAAAVEGGAWRASRSLRGRWSS
jgi:hypothetical protein